MMMTMMMIVNDHEDYYYGYGKWQQYMMLTENNHIKEVRDDENE